MRVAVAADHGVRAEGAPAAHLASRGHEVLDLGAHDAAPSAYADHALAVGLAVLDGRAERAILISGSGVGVAARVTTAGIGAAVCHDHYSGAPRRRARRH